MFNTILMNLQFFAAGDVVNSTTGYTNVNTGVVTAFDTTSTLSSEMKTFYDTELLENTRAEMYYSQFAKTQALPEGHGPTIEFRKWNTFKKAGVLQEAVTPSAQKFGMSVKTCSVSQYGTYTAVSDKLELRAYDDIIGGAVEEMGASAAETQEALVRDGLLGNTSIMYADNITLATGAVASTPTSCGTMQASATVRSMLTPKMVAKVVTSMKKNRVPQIDGSYVAIIHPSVAEDLRNSTDWINAHQYAAPEEIFNGEIGRLHGVRFIESAFAPVMGDSDHTDYQNAANGHTYATYFFGRDAFAIVDPAGGNLQMIVHDKSEIGGPLDQWSSIGYKFESGMIVLYPERIVNVMSCSPYSATDNTNY